MALAWALHSLEQDVGRRECGHWGTLSDSAREPGVPLIAVRRGDRVPSSTPLSVSHPTWSQWAGSCVTEKKVLALIGIWKCRQSSEVQQCSSNALSVAIVICASSPEVSAEYSVFTWMCLHEVLKIRAHIEIFVVCDREQRNKRWDSLFDQQIISVAAVVVITLCLVCGGLLHVHSLWEKIRKNH